MSTSPVRALNQAQPDLESTQVPSFKTSRPERGHASCYGDAPVRNPSTSETGRMTWPFSG